MTWAGCFLFYSMLDRKLRYLFTIWYLWSFNHLIIRRNVVWVGVIDVPRSLLSRWIILLVGCSCHKRFFDLSLHWFVETCDALTRGAKHFTENTSTSCRLSNQLIWETLILLRSLHEANKVRSIGTTTSIWWLSFMCFIWRVERLSFIS